MKHEVRRLIARMSLLQGYRYRYCLIPFRGDGRIPNQARTIHCLRKALFGAVSLLIFSLSLRAQSYPDFDLAESFFQAGNYERAAVLFEKLYAADRRTLYFDRLRVSLYETRAFQKLAGILEAELLRQKNNQELRMQYALCLFMLNRDKEAIAELERLTSELKTPQEFERLSRILIRQRQYPYVPKVVEIGRKRFSNPLLLSDEVASAYVISGKYAEATAEYLLQLKQDFPDFGTVQSQILSYATKDNPEVLKETIQAIESVKAQYTKAVAKQVLSQLLSGLYIEAEDYDGALREALRRDDMISARGAQVLIYGQTAFERKRYLAATSAFAIIVAKEATYSPFYVQQARLGLAKAGEEAAAQLDRDTRRDSLFGVSLRTYSDYESRYPTAIEAPDVMLAQIRIYYVYLRDKKKALDAIQSLLKRFSETQAARHARLFQAKIRREEGDMVSASEVAKRLYLDPFASREVKAEAQFLSAEMAFYLGQPKEAITLLSTIESGRNAANDALELRLFLQRALSDTSRNPTAIEAINRFAAAHRLLISGQIIPAEAAFNQWMETFGNASPPLSITDRVLYDWASVSVESEMIKHLESLIQRFPKSLYADKALFRLGSHFESKVQLTDSPLTSRKEWAGKAIGYYERLLKDYPKSIQLRSARERVRKLRAQWLS